MCIGPHVDNHCRNYGKNSFAQLYLSCIVSFIIDECMVYQCFFSEIFFRGGKANRNRGGRGYS